MPLTLRGKGEVVGLGAGKKWLANTAIEAAAGALERLTGQEDDGDYVVLLVKVDRATVMALSKFLYKEIGVKMNL